MTVKGYMFDTVKGEGFETDETDQVDFRMFWDSRGKWYPIATMTFTHNPEYPTPAIHVTAPNPGIRFTVSDRDGNVVFTNVKERDENDISE